MDIPASITFIFELAFAGTEDGGVQGGVTGG